MSSGSTLKEDVSAVPVYSGLASTRLALDSAEGDLLGPAVQPLADLVGAGPERLRVDLAEEELLGRLSRARQTARERATYLMKPACWR
jgi:hypothetical protein